MPICKHLKPVAECPECNYHRVDGRWELDVPDATIARIRSGLVEAGKRLGVKVVVPEEPKGPTLSESFGAFTDRVAKEVDRQKRKPLGNKHPKGLGETKSAVKPQKPKTTRSRRP